MNNKGFRFSETRLIDLTFMMKEQRHQIEIEPATS